MLLPGLWSRKDFEPEESESQKILTSPTPGWPFARRLWLFVSQMFASVTLGNLSSLTFQQKMIMKGCSTLTRMATLRGDPGQQRHSGSSRNICWVSATFRGLRHWNFQLLSFWLALSLLCDVGYATMNKQIVLMRTPLLRITRHRAMITPVRPVRTRLIHISPNSRTNYRSFEIILEWGPSIRLEFKCCMQIHCFKKHSIWYELTLKKYLIAEGSSGSNGLARVKRERTYSWEPLLCYEKYFLI